MKPNFLEFIYIMCVCVIAIKTKKFRLENIHLQKFKFTNGFE